MLKVGLIVGSTRPNRFADTPVQWLVEGASARRDLQLTVLDLRDFELPLLKEPVPPSFTGGAYSQPEAEAFPRAATTRWLHDCGAGTSFKVPNFAGGGVAVVETAVPREMERMLRSPMRVQVAG
jgi:hypothetical protein